MKSSTLHLIILGFFSLFLTSCEEVDNAPKLIETRKVKFILYTEKDFSAQTDNITFTAAIKMNNQVLWDSVLPPMTIKDIPTKAKPITFEKMVPKNEASLLRVGFIYNVENVGISWYWDRFEEGQEFKTIEFKFQ